MALKKINILNFKPENGYAKQIGFDCFRSYYYTIKLSIPSGYREVKKGKTKKDDEVMVAVEPFPKSGKNKTHVFVKGKWEKIELRYIGFPVNNFRAVIRKTKGDLE